MTRLFIDNKEVNLPSDMELELYRCNPFFTKNGDYTFEIDIDLKDQTNRKVYQNIQRLDVTKRPENRSALMICDGIKVIEGTEIVLSMEEDKAKIQLVADNSDINYLLGDDESIRDYDLGADTVTKEDAVTLIEKYYPESNFAICPVQPNSKKSKLASSGNRYNSFVPSSYGNQQMASNSEAVSQPYILYILQKVIESLGYTIAYNQLTQTDLFCRIFFLNSYKGEGYNKLAPEMTREEFIEECEKFFNCVLVADSIKKQVSIYQINTFYDNKPKTYIKEVLEDITKEYDNEETVNMNYTNVAYGSKFTDIFKRVDKDIVEKCETVEWDDFSTLASKAFSSDYYNKFYIHKVKGDGIEYVPQKYDVGQSMSAHMARVFNRFADIVDEDDEDSDKVELNFIPASINTITGDNCMYEYVRDSNDEISSTDEQDFLDALTDGLEEESTPNCFLIAINAGVQPCWTSEAKPVAGKYTVQSWIDEVGYCEATYMKDGKNNGTPYPSWTHFNTELTLALKGENGLYTRFYSKNKKVNTKVKYTISFITDKILDPKTIFVINNQEYYCNQLKYTIKADGKSRVVEGEFYRIENE